MTHKDIRQLVSVSFSKNQLDEKKVARIAHLLSRKDLKKYIRGLKLAEKKHNVYVATAAKNVYNTKELTVIFRNKQFVFTFDPSLLLGQRIVDDDMVYDVSLKSRLEHFLSQLTEDYDE
ncbi:MAG TPA: hypothetical protein VGT05_01285 [Patescibacteria group bacterium]|nr:hypothetical protein [Patescibacteria group bacterium]